MSDKIESEHLIGTIDCPCGGRAHITEDKDGKPASLMHTLPMCEEFETLTPADYLHWARTKREGMADA